MSATARYLISLNLQHGSGRRAWTPQEIELGHVLAEEAIDRARIERQHRHRQSSATFRATGETLTT